MALSEKELLLLDCFMYADIAPNSAGMSVEDIISQYVGSDGKVDPNKLKKPNVHLSGSITKDQMADVMNQMLENPEISRLKLTHATDEYQGSIRAACFVDPETQKATVAFRGTGGSYQQWMNNFEGYGDEWQQSQNDAAEFINSLPYDNIDVTGHSNGGNQAMYVTLVCGDKVSRCVSYEGQGFSKEFVEAYADQIRENEDKIKNISGSKDFVDPLLIEIGEFKWVESDSSALGYFNHGSYGILTANEDNFDEEGNFTDAAYVDQDPICQGISAATELLSWASDLPYVGPAVEYTADVVGIIVALAISGGWKDPDILIRAGNDILKHAVEYALAPLEKFAVSVVEVATYIKNWFDEKVLKKSQKYANEHPSLKINTGDMKNLASRLEQVNRNLAKVDSRLDSLYTKVKLADLYDLIVADSFTDFSTRLKKAVAYLRDTANDFEKADNAIAGKVQS